MTCIIKINNSSAWEAYSTIARLESSEKKGTEIDFAFSSAQIIKINNKNAKKSFIFQTFLLYLSSACRKMRKYTQIFSLSIVFFPSLARHFPYPSIMITKFSESWKIVGHNLFSSLKEKGKVFVRKWIEFFLRFGFSFRLLEVLLNANSAAFNQRIFFVVWLRRMWRGEKI